MYFCFVLIQAAFEAGRLNISEELDRWDQFSATEVERELRQQEIDAAKAQSAIDAEGEEDEIYLQLQSLAMKEKELGADHIGLGITLEKLARIYREQQPQRFDDAEAVLRRLLLVTQKEYGNAHMDVAKVLNNLGETLQAAGRHTEAVPLLEQALFIVLKCQGPHHQGDTLTLTLTLTLLHSHLHSHTHTHTHIEDFMRREDVIRSASRVPSYLFNALLCSSSLVFSSSCCRFCEQSRESRARTSHAS